VVKSNAPALMRFSNIFRLATRESSRGTKIIEGTELATFVALPNGHGHRCFADIF